MVEKQQETLLCDTVADLDSARAAWKQQVTAAAEMRDALAKATKSVNDYIRSQAKLSEKKKKDAAAKREKEEKEAARKRQLAAESALSAAEVPKAKLLFQSKWIKQKQETVAVVTHPPVCATMLDKPWVLAQHAEVLRWVSLPRVQLCLATFGGSYKKNAQFRDSASGSAGQVQVPLVSGKGVGLRVCVCVFEGGRGASSFPSLGHLRKSSCRK